MYGREALFNAGGRRCLHCLAKVSPFRGATLIVTPHAILGQWEQELHKHTNLGTLKVLVYDGVRSHTKKTRCILHPLYLAQFDVVLTTYATLRQKCIIFTKCHDQKFKKRFWPIPSPLVSLRWWRLALDEAQMVESSSAKAALMAANIAAVNRWAVTGTPFSRGSGLDDMYAC